MCARVENICGDPLREIGEAASVREFFELPVELM
jgi:hypothetical protein